MILSTLYIYIYIYSYTQYSFQRYVASLWEVAFKTHSSPSERVWLSMVWFTISCCTKGNPFIYTTIPLKEGDVSVIINRNAWNCHSKKYSVPCRKHNIILKGYSSISSCSFRDHSAACLYANFLERMQYIIFVHSFENRMVFLAQKKTTQTEPPPPENRKLGLAVQEILKKWFPPQPTQKNEIILIFGSERSLLRI